METTTLKTKKNTSVAKRSETILTQKPKKQTKVILGGGNKYGWVSDTCFDDDLKGW